MKRWTLVAMFLLASLDAGAQRRPPRRPPRGQTPSSAPTTPVTVAPAPTGPELVSVPIADVDRMMRQMRVWLFTPPPGATGYGLGRVAEGGSGARVWALLPSCRQANPDDPRDPCPVDRVIITSEDSGGGSVQSMDPQGLAPGAEARRVQSFMVPSGVRRVHIKLMALNNRVRYEAIVDVERLRDLPPPQGSPAASGFNFELAQYPAR